MFNGITYIRVRTLSNGSTISYPLTSNEMSSNSAIRFVVSIAQTISITDSDDSSTSVVYVQIFSGYVNGEDILNLTGTPSYYNGTLECYGRGI
jgi:hypothetical protein